MILRLIKGLNPEAEMRLRELKETTGENETVLWYPSSGTDFRDLLELSEEKRIQNGILEAPTLFVHTDKNEYLKIAEITSVEGADYAAVYIQGKYEVEFTGLEDGKAWLLDVCVKVAEGVELMQAVFHLQVDNYRFLDEILLKHKIKVTHLVKVRDGSTWGGESVCPIYLVLGELGVKYLLADYEINFDPKSVFLMREILTKYKLRYSFKAFKAEWIGLSIDGWSRKRVDICKLGNEHGILDRKKILTFFKFLGGEKNEQLIILWDTLRI